MEMKGKPESQKRMMNVSWPDGDAREKEEKMTTVNEEYWNAQERQFMRMTSNPLKEALQLLFCQSARLSIKKTTYRNMTKLHCFRQFKIA